MKYVVAERSDGHWGILAYDDVPCGWNATEIYESVTEAAENARSKNRAVAEKLAAKLLGILRSEIVVVSPYTGFIIQKL